MNTEHVLATIDAALDDWGTSDDAMRWAPDHVPDVILVIEPDFSGLAEASRALKQAMVEIQATMAEAARRWCEAGLASGVILDGITTAHPEPSDLREQALAHRRQRSTGPPPPRLDGRR